MIIQSYNSVPNYISKSNNFIQVDKNLYFLRSM